MNKKQKIKRIEELLMGYHIDSGLNPSKKAAKINKDYFLAEVTRVVTKKSKATTLDTSNVVLTGSNLLYTHVIDKAINTPNEGKPFRTTFDTYYIWDEYPQQIFFEGRYIRYGLTYTGEWFCYTEAYPRPISSLMRVATDEEILKRLSAYANSIGIKHNGFVTLLSGYIVKLYSTGDCIVKESNSFIFGNQVVMQGGVWATATKQADTPTTYIKHNKI